MHKFLRRTVKTAFRALGLEVNKAKVMTGRLDVIGEFADSKGHAFPLLKGYRRLLWGFDWEGMNQDRAVPSAETVRRCGYIQKGRDQAAQITRFLSIHGFPIEGRDILEVGCLDGATCYALTEAGCRSVHGIDYPEGFVPSVSPTEAQIRQQSDWLTALRDAVCREFRRESRTCVPERVTFSDQDIHDFRETDKRYDLIVSTNTLEHILDPHKAFRCMFEALRPGGMAFHNYHPFFCPTGAHFDACDFPWGHVRLDAQDFRRYIRSFRPQDIEISEYRFFRTLNRLTLADLRKTVSEAGFRMVDLHVCAGDILFGEDWQDVTPEIFSQCRANYPTVTLQDLTSSKVMVLMEKPIPLTGKNKEHV